MIFQFPTKAPLRMPLLLGLMVFLLNPSWAVRGSQGSPSLEAHWRFDETSGTTAADSAGSYPGQLSTTGSHFTPDGVLGGALEISRAANGFVDVGQVLPLTNTAFSVAVWVRTPPGDATPVAPIISKHRPGYGNGWYLLVNDPGNTGKVVGYVGDSIDYPVSTTTVTDGQWHHVVMVYEQGVSFRIFVDGSPQEDSTFTIPPNLSPAHVVIGGLDPSTPEGRFNGVLDELQIYSGALSDGDVATLYSSYSPPVVNPAYQVLVHPPAGIFASSVDVTMEVSPSGAEIRYSTDGSDPTAGSSPYPGALHFTTTTTVKAAAFRDGLQVSSITQARFEVLYPPNITSQLTSKSLSTGEPLLLSVTASGSAPLTYQWFHNEIAFPQGSSSVLSIPAVTVDDAGTYRVVVTNAVGAATSDSVSVSVQTSSPPPAVPIGRWRFDSISAATASDDLGQRPGTLSTNGSQIVDADLDGGALALQARLNGYVDLGDGLDLLDGPFSFSVWARTSPATQEQNMAIFAKHRPGTGNGWYLVVNDPANQSKAMAYVGSSFNRLPASTTTVNDGRWHHIVAVYRPAETLRVYVDGSPFEDSIASPSTTQSPARVVIGGVDPDKPIGTFTGWIDDLQVFTAALTDTDVESLYQAHSAAANSSVAPIVSISPSENLQVDSVTVRLTQSGERGEIRYTLNGSEPLPSSPRYEGEFQATQSVVVKAAVFLDGIRSSLTAEKRFEVLQAPRIVQQPSDLTVAPSTRVSLSVSASGSGPLSYAWFHDDAPIPGATSSLYEILSASERDGGLYTCRVTNRVGTATSSPARLTVRSSGDLPDSLIARWRFDDIGARTAAEDSGRYPGLLSPNGAAQVSGGVQGGALLVDRSANGFVNVGEVLPLINQSFTVASWIRMTPGDTTPISLIVSKHKRGFGNGWYMLVNDPGSLEGGVMGYVGDSAPDYPVSTTKANDGNWHHVAMVYQNGSSLKIYVDGAPAEDQAVAVPTRLSTAKVIIAGIDDGPPTGRFTGWVDDLRIYGTSLSSAQVDALFHSYEIPPPTPQSIVSIFPPGGNFHSSVSVSLSTSSAQGTIRYTLDGSAPTSNSSAYTGLPIDITSSTVLKAAAFTGSVQLGTVTTASFVIISTPGSAFTRVTGSPVTAERGEAIAGAWGDYDRDGDLDLFVTNVRGQRNALYRNDGAGTFTRVTDVTPVTEVGEYGGTGWGDFNNDGWIDLFATDFYRGTWVYPNLGGGQFGTPTLLTSHTGAVAAMAGSWADYNKDGLLDLFVAYGGGLNNATDELYQQQPGGGFAPVTEGVIVNSPGYSMGSAWSDYDNDGWPDLYVANGWLEQDLFFHNQGGTNFSTIVAAPFSAESGPSGAVAWGDFDNDGDQDLFVGFGGNDRSILYRNDGPAGFVKVTDAGIGLEPSLGVGAVWGDYDNDGWLDLYQSNRDQANTLYHNLGNGRFEKVTDNPAVTDVKASNGATWGDYDGDGFLDLFVANWDNQTSDLYHNVGNGNHWLKVRLVGTKSNKSGIGAKVRVKATIGGRSFWQLREINTGDGLGAPELAAHFGLGNASTVEVIRVEWPSGTVDEMTGRVGENFLSSIEANQVITITESATPPDRPIQVTPPGGTYRETITITLSGGPAGATLRYAMGDDTVSAHSTAYSAPFVVNHDTRLTVAAFINQQRVGEVVTNRYHFDFPPPVVRPSITRSPTDVAVLRGGTASFTVSASGTEPLEYRWYRGSNRLDGASSPTLTLNNVTTNLAGLYRAVVANTAGTATSAVARLTVQLPPPPQPPHIVSQSHDIALDAGESLTLSVEATGPQLSYAWYFNNAPITGANAASLVFASLTTDQGGTYHVVVSNPDGSVASDPIILTVRTVVVPHGGTVLFSNRIAGLLDSPVFDVDGTTRLDGVGYSAQFYAGPTPDSLQAWGNVVPFRSGAAAGYWVATTQTIRYVETVEPGSQAYVQARAWDASAGATYEEAVASGGRTGTSELLHITTGGAGTPPTLPAVLMGLPSFSLRPTAPPTITTPPLGQTVSFGLPLHLTVTADGQLLTYQWLKDGHEITGATTAHYDLASVSSLNAGSYTVRVTNPGGSVESAPAVIAVTVDRAVVLAGTEPTPEGGRVVLPVQLTSQGEVGGGTMVVRYDTNALADPQVSWSPLLADAFTQINASAPGEIRLVFALAATGVEPGLQELALVDFRARSVAGDSTTEVGLDALDLSDATGTPLRSGTEVRGTTVEILHRTLIGDSNGNRRLDVGDASIILQFLGLLETPRPWDVTGNDVNGSLTLDSGDVIRVLRSVVGLDTPAPSAVTAARRGSLTLQGRPTLSTPPATGPTSRLQIEPASGGVGTRVRVKVWIDAGAEALSGAAFTLRYLPEALRLSDTRSLTLGSLVPTSALALWNVIPANNFAAQEGVVRFGASTAKPWLSSTGVVAELLFEVQPGASFRHRWPITLDHLEVTRDGYDAETGGDAAAAFIGRAAQPPQVVGLGHNPGSPAWVFRLNGEPEVAYVIEASDDLLTWTPVGTASTSSNGELNFTDPGTTPVRHRFYRAVQAP